MPDRFHRIPLSLPHLRKNGRENGDEQCWRHAVEQLRRSAVAPGQWQHNLYIMLETGKKQFPDRLQQEIRRLLETDGLGSLTRHAIDHLHYSAPDLLEPLIGELLPRTHPHRTPDPDQRRWLWDRLRHHVSSAEAFPWVCAAAETEPHPTVLEALGNWVALQPHHQRLTLEAILSRRLREQLSQEHDGQEETELRLWELRLRANYGIMHHPLVEDITRRIQTAPIPLAGQLISLAQHTRLTTERYLTDHLLDAILKRGDPVQTRAGELFARLAAPPCPPGYLEYRLIDRGCRGDLHPSPNVLRWVDWLLDRQRLNPGPDPLLPPLSPDQWEELHHRAASLRSPQPTK